MTHLFPDRAALMLVALAAAMISAGLIVLLRPLLQRYALARPNARSSHAVPTPQGAGTAFIALVGLADDIRPIPVPPRLLLQAAAVGAVILTAPAELRIAPMLPLAVERGALLVAGLW